VADKSS